MIARIGFLTSVLFFVSCISAQADTRLIDALDQVPAFYIDQVQADPVHSSILNVGVRVDETLPPSTFILHDPVRVVIDIPSAITGTKNKTITGTGSQILTSVRIGSHPDKTRIVLDLQAQTKPAVSVERQAEFAVVKVLLGAAVTSIGPTPLSTTAPKPLATPAVVIPGTATPTIIPTAASTPSPSPAPTETSAPTATPFPTVTPSQTTPVPTLPPISSNTRISGLNFEYAGSERSPAIRINLDVRSEFKLSKTGEKTYTLSVPQASLGAPGLALAQYPPHDFIGFTFLQAQRKGEDVELTIGVERGIRITAVAQERDIVIRALNR